jgi:hypothetical protein
MPHARRGNQNGSNHERCATGKHQQLPKVLACEIEKPNSTIHVEAINQCGGANQDQ